MVGGLAVQSPPPDVPCGGDYTANTQVSLARKIVVVERFYRDGARETVRTPLKDITRVEIERIQQAKGGHCSVIYMRLKNGTRIRFAESLTQDLKARGFKLAADLKTQVEVTRLDGVTVDAEVE